jgi:5-methylthioadenosine/S-adenosylhomocysteine deaminase
MKTDDLYNGRHSLLITNTILQGKPAEILVNDEGLIEEIGEHTGSRAEFTIDGQGGLVLPGLINTHTHAAMSLLRGYADDMILSEWLTQKIWPLEAHLTGDDVYWGTKLACLEMIRTGTLAFNDMYFFMQDAAKAVVEMGIRAQLSHGFIDLANPEKREVEIKATEKLAADIENLGCRRVRTAVGPHAVYTVSPEGLRWCADFAEEKKIGIHIHLSETDQEVRDCVASHGKRPPALLDECGILTERTVAAHGCWLDESDCATLSKRGVSVSHNPASNMKLSTGRAMPYPVLRNTGVNACLGSDGCASNNNLDLFEEMKTAALLQKFAWNDPTVLPAGEAVTMATINGAKALGLSTGSIEVGRPADLIIIRSDAVCNTPCHQADSNIAYSCNGSAVSTSICDGVVLMYGGTVPGAREVLVGAGKAASELVQRAGAEK